jgi:hypothetical protein
MAANEEQVGGDHYKKHGALQHWDIVHLFKLDYFQGQITKYVMRWKDKNGIQDLQKAAHFLKKYIELNTPTFLGVPVITDVTIEQVPCEHRSQERARDQQGLEYWRCTVCKADMAAVWAMRGGAKTGPQSPVEQRSGAGLGVGMGAFTRARDRIVDWVRSRYGDEVLLSRKERAARLFEEAAELAQAEGLTRDLVFKILQRAYNRDRGEPGQEASGVMLTLLAWSYTSGVDLVQVCEKELDRVEKVPIEVSRKKHMDKEAAGTAVALTKR